MAKRRGKGKPRRRRPQAPDEVLDEQQQQQHGDSEHQADLLQLLEALAPLPLEQIGEVLGEMLFPNASVEDLGKWQGNVALVEALRNLYLRKRFGEGDYVRRLKATLQPDFLPSRDELIELFELRRPPADQWQRAGPRDHLLRKEELLAAGEVAAWSFEDRLEALGCAVWGRGAYNLCCEDTGRYEFLTREMVRALAQYLAGRLAQMGDDARVVEVGAGSGSLSHFVNRELEALGAPQRCVATDPDTRAAPRQRFGLSGEKGPYAVQRLTYQEAIEAMQPSIVLCAWMPMDTDWSADFRAAACVQEYVLIGEADFGACGHNFRTWGNAEFAAAGEGSEPPFAAARWTRHDLHDISKWQMQRYDSDFYSGNSVTVSFRRPAAPEGQAPESSPGASSTESTAALAAPNEESTAAAASEASEANEAAPAPAAAAAAAK